jgi:predicted lipoprotein
MTTVRTRRSRPLASFATTAVVVAGVAGCVAGCIDGGAPPPGEEARRALLVGFVDEDVVPALDAAVANSADLKDATAALAAVAGHGEGERQRAKDAWRALMNEWQHLEMWHLGPAGDPAVFVSGEGLRERIYAWPEVNRCGVDQQVVFNEFNEAGWADTKLVNVLGLAALEHLLFTSTDDNVCAAQAAINRDGLWNDIPVDERQRRRAQLAAVLAADVDAQLRALRERWTPFGDALKTAGAEGSAFASAQVALDQLYAALFAVELVTKDQRLGVPAGIHPDCGDVVCVDQLESPVANLAREHVSANLTAVARVYFGGDVDDDSRVGLADLLREQGANDIATAMGEHLSAARVAVDAFDGDFAGALVTEPERVGEVHVAVKRFTDELKGSLPGILGVRVPAEGAGDND